MVESKPQPSSKRNRTSGAPQPARDDDDACQPSVAPKSVSSVTHNAGNHLERHIREFWETRGAEGATVQKEVKHLRFLLFRKKKHPVTQDIWIPGASPVDSMQPFCKRATVLLRLSRTTRSRDKISRVKHSELGLRSLCFDPESSDPSEVAVIVLRSSKQRSFSGCCRFACEPERFSVSLPSDLELVAFVHFVPTELPS